MCYYSITDTVILMYNCTDVGIIITIHCAQKKDLDISKGLINECAPVIYDCSKFLMLNYVKN